MEPRAWCMLGTLSLNCLGQPQTCEHPASAFWIAKMTGMQHNLQLAVNVFAFFAKEIAFLRKCYRFN